MSTTYDRNALFSAEGLVAVITGGGSGLGKNVALALDANGATAVYILGRRKESLDKTVKEGTNGSIKPIICDVTSKESLSAAASQVRKEHGYINVVFANSGIVGPTTSSLFTPGKTASVQEMQETLFATPMEDFTSTMHVNVTGAFYTAIAFLDLLDEGNKRGVVPQKSQIIVTTSIAAYGRIPGAGFAYSASKAAATQMVKQLATSLAPHKIRANAICPGFYPSEMTESMSWMQGGADPRVEGGVPQSLVPLERTGSEEDIGGLALFLMSRAGAYINGCVQLTDGGRVGIFPSGY